GARGDRIGGIGGNQDGGPVAAADRALEACRNFDREQDLAGCQQLVELGLVLGLIYDLEVARVLQRAENRAAEVALLLKQYGGRQIARIRVDGVAEQDELHQRDHDDHRERDAVALELDELLDQHRDGATPEAADGTRLRSYWSIALHAHWKLSCALARRSM